MLKLGSTATVNHEYKILPSTTPLLWLVWSMGMPLHMWWSSECLISDQQTSILLCV